MGTGMESFKELSAANTSCTLKIILLKGNESKNNDILDFCTKEIYPLYLGAVTESFETENEEINKIFEKRLKKIIKKDIENNGAERI